MKLVHKSHFSEYFKSESVALIFDLLFLWALVHFFSLNYILAAGIAYLVAITLHYHTTRHHIFRGTIRTTYTGFAYFLAVGVLGLAVALITMTILIKISGATYLFARLIATIAIIPVTYVSNKYLTFIMPRPLPDEKNLYCNIPG